MKTKTLLTLALLFYVPFASARSINWGNTVEDSLFDSSGTNALNAGYVFELGTFGSFVPDMSNIALWEANWKVLDQATTANGKWDSSPTVSQFSSTVDLLSDGTSSASPPLPSFTFGQDEQAYIWAFNTKTLAVGTTEWALITNNASDGNTADDWKLPAPADHSVLPLDWLLPLASQAIIGGQNNQQGGGDYTPPTGGYDLQTHTLSVVPEPSGVLLIATAGLLLQLRRRSRTLAN